MERFELCYLKGLIYFSKVHDITRRAVHPKPIELKEQIAIQLVKVLKRAKVLFMQGHLIIEVGLCSARSQKVDGQGGKIDANNSIGVAHGGMH